MDGSASSSPLLLSELDGGPISETAQPSPSRRGCWAAWSSLELQECQLLMEGGGIPKHCPLAVSAATPAASPGVYLAISPCPASAEVDICPSQDSSLALMRILRLQKGLATNHEGAFSVGW